jgi:type I restriction enzyme R subunit/putative DNA methylase
LPHYDDLNKTQAVTFRLADSLPQEHLDRLALEIAAIPAPQLEATRRKKIEQWLDAGIGCCALRHPSLATVVQETLLKFDAQRYRLLAWCIMPNHVHVLLQPEESLSRILQSWKSYTGRWALTHNRELGLRIPGKSLWMREAWDRFIRDVSHLRNVEKYILENPVKAGLCPRPEDWPWSSASFTAPGNAEPQLGTAQERNGVGGEA